MAKNKPPSGLEEGHHFAAQITAASPAATYKKGQKLFAQGGACDSIFYIQKGEVTLTVISARGKEAVIAILGDGAFCGEGCLAGQPLRISTAVATKESEIIRVAKPDMIEILHGNTEFSKQFMVYMLARNIRVEGDLIDQLFNSSEKRLARVLLLMANFGKEGKSERVIAKISQETLAEMVGTTRSRVSSFMNKFRKLGLIEYNGEMVVHSSLLNVVLHETPNIRNGDTPTDAMLR